MRNEEGEGGGAVLVRWKGEDEECEAAKERERTKANLREREGEPIYCVSLSLIFSCITLVSTVVRDPRRTYPVR